MSQLKYMQFIFFTIFMVIIFSNCNSVTDPISTKAKETVSLTAPDLQKPQNHEAVHDRSPLFLWSGVDDADFYQIQVAEDENFSTLVVSDSSEKETYELTLTPEKTYYWRVRAINTDSKESEWSDQWTFSTVRISETEPDTTKPAVAVTPQQNVTEGSEITITATAEDASGIKSIELFIGEDKVKICEHVTSCSYSSSSYKAGTYAYFAVAVDSSVNHNRSKSEIKQFTVTPHEPANGTYKIMPLGDSITESSGYRVRLWDKLTGAGYSIDYVGSQSKPHPDLPDTDHEGHGGWKIADIAGKINGWLGTYQPEYVLLMIGTNDVAWWQDKSGARVAEAHAALVDQILANAPEYTWVLVASIPPESSKSINPNNIDRAQLVRDFNHAMEEQMQRRSANGKKVVFVDVYSRLTMSHISGDGVHPNSSGYEAIAQAWFEKLQTILP